METQINKFNDNNLEYYRINNFFTNKEIFDFFNLFYYLKPYLREPQDTGGAKGNDSTPKKLNKGIFLKSVEPYPIFGHKLFEKVINLLSYISISSPKSSIYNLCYESFNTQTLNYDILISHYSENGSKYDKHYDESLLTFICWFEEPPLNFTGGELILDNAPNLIPPKNNSAILFPGYIKHQVTPLKIKNPNLDKGRIAISLFLIKNF